MMKKLLKKGKYTLIETKGNTKILILESLGIFAWINAEKIGGILVKAHNKFKLESILAMGDYKLYNVKEEPKLVDLEHLELMVGDGSWQGYLLPKGIPSSKEKRHRIIPTNELVQSYSGRNMAFDGMVEKVELLANNTIRIS
jgi:hypothetical protein